jgi:hypothetical protein
MGDGFNPMWVKKADYFQQFWRNTHQNYRPMGESTKLLGLSPAGNARLVVVGSVAGQVDWPGRATGVRQIGHVGKEGATTRPHVIRTPETNCPGARDPADVVDLAGDFAPWTIRRWDFLWRFDWPLERRVLSTTGALVDRVRRGRINSSHALTAPLAERGRALSIGLRRIMPLIVGLGRVGIRIWVDPERFFR